MELVEKRFPYSTQNEVFSIVRMDGTSDCFRLRNNLGSKTRPFIWNGEPVGPEVYCQHLQQGNHFLDSDRSYFNRMHKLVLDKKNHTEINRK
jgi:hypothetical protein